MAALPRHVARRRLALPEREVEIALLDWGGSGPPALWHHANGFCGAVFGPLVQRLGGRYRVFTLDARGHGDSSRPDPDVEGAYRWSVLADDLVAVARALREELAVPRFALGLGHSFGGTLTLAAAARSPGLYERILMVDPVIFPPVPQAERAAHGSVLATRARRRRDGWVSRAEARAFFAAKDLFADWDPGALDLYVEEGLRERADGSLELKCPGAVEGAIFSGDTGMDIFQLAAAVAVPTRLLWARRGNFDRAIYETLIAPMPRADVVEADAGHLMVMEAPDLVARELQRFADAPASGFPISRAPSRAPDSRAPDSRAPDPEIRR